MSFMPLMPDEMAKKISENARAKRLSLNLSRKSLSERSGVSQSVIKQFENTGKMSLTSLLKLALALGALEEFSRLFKVTSTLEDLSLDDVLQEKPKRQRGRE